MADVSIRRLVETTTLLDAAALAGQKSSKRHALSEHIKRGKAYVTSDGKIPLPNRASAIMNLVASRDTPLLHLPAPAAQAIWGRTVGSPSQFQQLRDPTSADLDDLEIPVPAGWGPRLRRFSLARVFDLPAIKVPEYEDGPLRVAASADLVLLLDTANRSVDDAWIRFTVDTSTVEFAKRLEVRLAKMSASDLDRLSAKAVNVIVHADHQGFPGDPQSLQLRVSAALFGIKLRFVRLSRASFQDAYATLAADHTPALITLGPLDSSMVPLVEAARTQGAICFRIDNVESGSTLSNFRHVFSLIAGMEANLVARGERPSRRGQIVPLAPIVRTDKCLHDQSGRYYVHDADTDLWWSADTAGHAGSTFKTFSQQNATLVHQACRDPEGKVIDKSKGEDGARIEMGRLHGCTHPESHIQGAQLPVHP